LAYLVLLKGEILLVKEENGMKLKEWDLVAQVFQVNSIKFMITVQIQIGGPMQECNFHIDEPYPYPFGYS